MDLTRDETLVAASGYDRAEFLVRTNPGSRLGPLMKVASGGELARFLLALKVRLSERSTAPTLVFDEIDTGVGGAVADAMGQRLARLATKAQVLAVTHAPQVAARAQNHYRIAKSAVGGGERVATSVARLDRDDRREEIARMLAGRGDHPRGAGGRRKPHRKGRVTGDCAAEGFGCRPPARSAERPSRDGPATAPYRRRIWISFSARFSPRETR